MGNLTNVEIRPQDLHLTITDRLYFVSPRVQNKTLVIVRRTSVFSHTLKKESRD